MLDDFVSVYALAFSSCFACSWLIRGHVITSAGSFTAPSGASWIGSASGLTTITRFATSTGNTAANMTGATASAGTGQLVGRAMAAGKSFLGGSVEQPGGGQGGNGFQNTNKAA
jgi:hypothetical protein